MKMAEYGWGLSQELVQKAQSELHENPEIKAQAIDVVRDQIVTRPDIKFLRTDDAFVIRFLRARKFDTFEAFKLLGRYFEYRQNNQNIFKDFNASEQNIKEALFDGIPAVLEKTDHFGRKILVLYSANWDNSRYGLAAIYRAILLTLEKLIDEEECQINGFVIIVDWSQFTFRQSTWLNPKILRSMIEGLQDCFPARFSAIHFVNQPWYIEAVFKMLKPFLKEKNRNKIHFHGINLGTLHNAIHKEVLPAELGGTEPPYNNQNWAKQLIGDENFSFSDKHIYWPNTSQIKKCNKPWIDQVVKSLHYVSRKEGQSSTLQYEKEKGVKTLHHMSKRTRSKSFPSDFYTEKDEEEEMDTKGTYLDEEFFLIE